MKHEQLFFSPSKTIVEAKAVATVIFAYIQRLLNETVNTLLLITVSESLN